MSFGPAQGSSSPVGSGFSVQAGSSSTFYKPVTVQAVSVAAVGNVGAGEDDLITATLPANALSTNGMALRITAWGTTANNATGKTLKVYLGTQILLTNALTASIAGVWRAECIVVRTGVGGQDYSGSLMSLGAAGVALNDVENGAATQDETAALAIKCTGEAGANNDIVQEGLVVELLN